MGVSYVYVKTKCIKNSNFFSDLRLRDQIEIFIKQNNILQEKNYKNI